ncbi:MAG: hypothetical protein N2171_01710 [Clostridia bacterium]|nr:hypothetical protein [Clostridia bacterium]
MNVCYVYLQIYRLFDDATPINADCGRLCRKACCRGDDLGMYLFPGEKSVYEFLKPDWIKIENSDFTYFYDGQKKSAPIAFCNGVCDRYQRPLSCRIFPLVPFLTDDGKVDVIVDPRAKAVCPLASLDAEDYDRTFVKNVKKTFSLLCKNKQVYAFMKEYTMYLNGYKKFFK